MFLLQAASNSWIFERLLVCQLTNQIHSMELKLFLLYSNCILRVVAVDLRGCNLTERPDQMKNYKLNVLVEDLKALIDHFSKFDWRHHGIIIWDYIETATLFQIHCRS